MKMQKLTFLEQVMFLKKVDLSINNTVYVNYQYNTSTLLFAKIFNIPQSARLPLTSLTLHPLSQKYFK